uniref:Uncharacterized protein n=1 Tax=Romanomermis culicivorax TaxID=13658 RepID=A0A915LA13_ROMCU
MHPFGAQSCSKLSEDSQHRRLHSRQVCDKHRLLRNAQENCNFDKMSTNIQQKSSNRAKKTVNNIRNSWDLVAHERHTFYKRNFPSSRGR